MSGADSGNLNIIIMPDSGVGINVEAGAGSGNSIVERGTESGPRLHNSDNKSLEQNLNLATLIDARTRLHNIII